MENNSSEILKHKILKIFNSSNLSMPNHVGIIMDGNRRWAAENRKPVFFGHKEGTKNLQENHDHNAQVGRHKHAQPSSHILIVETHIKMYGSETQPGH